MKHKASKTPLKAAKESWKGMKRRCTDPKYHAAADYFHAGIRYPEHWNSFELFLLDMGLPTIDLENGRFRTLDRINNNESYSKDNCRWATKQEQGLNSRNSFMHRLGFNELKINS